MQLVVVPLSQDFIVQGNEAGFDDWSLAVMAMVGKFLFPRGISYLSSCVVEEREEKKDLHRDSPSGSKLSPQTHNCLHAPVVPHILHT